VPTSWASVNPFLTMAWRRPPQFGTMRRVFPSPSKAHCWGVVERWSYPDDGYGDCEDYALLKRRMLIEAGWAGDPYGNFTLNTRNSTTRAISTEVSW
jgi:hypothetical protein